MGLGLWSQLESLEDVVGSICHGGMMVCFRKSCNLETGMVINDPTIHKFRIRSCAMCPVAPESVPEPCGIPVLHLYL